ncbi:unnamed protein product, partial [Nesidiocoris tenuis]
RTPTQFVRSIVDVRLIAATSTTSGKSATFFRLTLPNRLSDVGFVGGTSAVQSVRSGVLRSRRCVPVERHRSIAVRCNSAGSLTLYRGFSAAKRIADGTLKCQSGYSSVRTNGKLWVTGNSFWTSGKVNFVNGVALKTSFVFTNNE